MARTIATNTTVDRDELTALRPCHHMILLTPRRDAGWQGSPVTAGVDAEGRIVIATYPAIRITPQRWGPIATGGFPVRFA